MKHVKVTYIGIVHYYATCSTCGWTYEDYTDRKAGRREIRKHVRKTGHMVQLEKGICSQYTLEG